MACVVLLRKLVGWLVGWLVASQFFSVFAQHVFTCFSGARSCLGPTSELLLSRSSPVGCESTGNK